MVLADNLLCLTSFNSKVNTCLHTCLTHDIYYTDFQRFRGEIVPANLDRERLRWKLLLTRGSWDQEGFGETSHSHTRHICGTCKISFNPYIYKCMHSTPKIIHILLTFIELKKKFDKKPELEVFCGSFMENPSLISTQNTVGGLLENGMRESRRSGMAWGHL